MIKINIKKDCIKISGHAMFDDYGKDIVCASVSSIAITTVNAILRLDDKAISYKQNEGLLEINILKHSKTIDTLVLNMISLFKELELQYKQNIQILEEV